MAVTTQWRGQKDTQRWRFYTLLGFSFVLHSAFTPWAAFLGLLGLLGLADPVQTEDLPAMTAIPIDLFEEDEKEATAAPPKPEPEPAPDAPALEDPQIAGEPVVAPAPEESEPKQGDPESQQTEQRENIADPATLNGTAGKVTDPNANVQLRVDTEKVRKHPLGLRIGNLLAQVPQWRDFFGTAKLNAIEDIDQVAITGPQFRDSSEVAAVIKYNVTQAQIEAAVDQLVKRSGGEWLDGPVRAATARADRAERVFVFIPEQLVAVVPETMKKSTLALGKQKLSLPPIPGDAVLSVSVVTPYRVFLGLPFRFPESVKKMKASVTPTADGGAKVVLLGVDESKEAAARNAKLIEGRILDVMSPKGLARLLGGSARYIETVEFHAEDEEIHGIVTVTAQQLDSILNLAQLAISMFAPPPRPATPAASSSALPSGGDTAAPNTVGAPVKSTPPASRQSAEAPAAPRPEAPVRRSAGTPAPVSSQRAP